MFNRVFCFFEQSGTFKKAFIEKGFSAYDVDICNDFKQVDFQLNLFHEIISKHNYIHSFLDDINFKDLVIAFFPCTYFCSFNELLLSTEYTHSSYLGFSTEDVLEKQIDRYRKRTRYIECLLKLVFWAKKYNIPLIIENPAKDNFLIKNNVLKKPDIIDYNRKLRGDYFTKPTAYWFYNLEPTFGLTRCEIKNTKHISLLSSGISRSLISIEYARNFLKDFIFGETEEEQLQLFNPG